ncbi:hypothetical protein FF2_000653 [Malus domestica]
MERVDELYAFKNLGAETDPRGNAILSFNRKNSSMARSKDWKRVVDNNAKAGVIEGKAVKSRHGPRNQAEHGEASRI